MEVHASVMEIGGKRALISLLVDVTERVRAARELQALQEGACASNQFTTL